MLAILLVLSVLLFLFLKNIYQRRLRQKEIEKLRTENDVIKLNAFIEGEEKERTRLSQELHDGINGDLAGLKFLMTAMTANPDTIDQKTFKESLKL